MAKFQKGHSVSQEVRDKISRANLGNHNLGVYPRTETYRQKMSKIASERVGTLNSFFGKHHSKEARVKMSEIAIEQYQTGVRDTSGEKNSMFGRHLSEETKRKKSEAMTQYIQEHPEYMELLRDLSTGENNARFGIHLSKELRQRISASHLKGREPKASLENQFRKKPEWAEWREAVFKRDDYTCQLCGQKGSCLHPHHIKRVADNPELIFIISNGIALCFKCHGLVRQHEEEYESYFKELLCLKEEESRQSSLSPKPKLKQCLVLAKI